MYYATDTKDLIKTIPTTLRKCLVEAHERDLNFVMKTKDEGRVYTIFISPRTVMPSSFVGLRGLTKHEIKVCKEFCEEYSIIWN
jgi:hypothetical protein